MTPWLTRVLAVVFLGLGLSSFGQVSGGAAAGAKQAAAAAAAFERMMPVLRHPRCMNCHSKGDYPRQGDDRHVHLMEIRRGADGHGLNVVKCSGCHQTENAPGLHAPPGAEGWHLPPRDMPMIWEGRTDRELCELLKDPEQNGHKTIEEIVEHMGTPLVVWGWHPGEGRKPVPGTAEQFRANAKAWAANGAACPGATGGSGASGRKR